MIVPPQTYFVQATRAARRAAFTLVELLVVISVMALLTTLASISFVRVGRAHSLTNAGNQMVAMLRLARQNSMTKNAMTALVIPGDKDGWNSYILYELSSRSDGSAPSTSDWRPISNWEKLPSSVVFDECKFALSDVPNELPALPAIKSPSGEPTDRCCYIVFTATGSLYPFSYSNTGGPDREAGNPVIRIAEGLRKGEELTDIVYPGAKNGAPTNYYRVTVLSTTGTPKIDRL